MKMSDKNKMLILVGIGILVLVLSIFVFYPQITSEDEELKQQISMLDSERDQLEQLMAKKGDYENEALTMQSDLEKMKAQFPAKIHDEDIIMDVVRMGEELDVEISSVSSTEPEQVLLEGTDENGEGTDVSATNTDDGTDTSESDAENLQENGMQNSTADFSLPELEQQYTSNYSLYKVSENITFTTDYTGLKNVISYLKDLDKKNRGVISSITASFTKETGMLECTADINNYYMEGMDKAYEEPAIPNVDIGVPNLFGTINESSARESGSDEGESEESNNSEGEAEETTQQ